MTVEEPMDLAAIVPIEQDMKSSVTFEELVVLLDADVEGNGVDMASGFVEPNDLFEPVMIRLKPGKAIPEEVDRKHDIVGMLLACEDKTVLLRVGLCDPYPLSAGDDFRIPAGTHYSVQNTSTFKEALLKFLINL